MLEPTKNPKPTPYNQNLFNWSGFYKSEDDAEKGLHEKLKLIAEHEHKLIISAKKELQSKKCQDLLLYKFTVITNDKK
jgi:hypothetical protein